MPAEQIRGGAPLPDERLDAIEAREKVATPGPMEASANAVHRMVTASYGTCVLITHTDDQDQRRADALFYAHAREDVPALLAEVRRLRAVVAEAATSQGATVQVIRCAALACPLPEWAADAEARDVGVKVAVDPDGQVWAFEGDCYFAPGMVGHAVASWIPVDDFDGLRFDLIGNLGREFTAWEAERLCWPATSAPLPVQGQSSGAAPAFEAKLAGDVDPDAEYPGAWEAVRGKRYVCTVHGEGLFDDDSDGDRAAAFIASLLNAHAQAGAAPHTEDAR